MRMSRFTIRRRLRADQPRRTDRLSALAGIALEMSHNLAARERVAASSNSFVVPWK